MSGHFLEVGYLIAAVLFITGLKWMSSPEKARRGNQLSALGMLIAVIATLMDRQVLSYELIITGLIVGAIAGLGLGRRVKMTTIPQMVALLNGFGGCAAQLVAIAEWHRLVQSGAAFPVEIGATIYLSCLIGTVTFSGSLIAAAKLQEIIPGKPLLFQGQQLINLLLLLIILGIGIYLLNNSDNASLLLLFVFLAFLLGIGLTIPIGGADMPIMICLLNSYSGIAAATMGFVIVNHGLIITGALIGASGIVLTKIMCKAMNRSLTNVLFGGIGGTRFAEIKEAGGAVRTTHTISVEDAAVALNYAGSVIFVPGYGMAVAQAQHEVRELYNLLQEQGVDVKFGIHPVAGRMPGHMNVLLAEAEVPYDKLYDLESINPQFEHSDLVMIVGANDVVNPEARTDPASPLYGMPILNADRAKHIIIMKRSMHPGFAGVDNELFYNQKTSLLFGDARKTLSELIAEMKRLRADL
jgi:H+-translocating NAD(P) transhydrogenase subunit beta